MKRIILIAAVITLSSFIWQKDIKEILHVGTETKKQGKKEKKKKTVNIPAEIKIKAQWDLPEILKEVSGIAYLDNDRFACVQDELGTIFIFNKASKKIEKEISFTSPGDFEGIALKGNTAYIVRADGILFEVNMLTKKTKQYDMGSGIAQNLEGLCYDNKNNRLLLAGKDNDPALPGYKGIYAFDIASNSFIKTPVFKIEIGNQGSGSKTKKNNTLMPSAIGIHPITHDLFIIDGPKARLLILDEKGNIKKPYELGKSFAQPEGLTFTPRGDIYISNEGKKNAANIMHVEIAY